MKYRPLGYGVRAEDPTGPADPTPRRRSRWLVLAAALFVTVALHAGIAVAFDADSSAPRAAPTAKGQGDECEADLAGADEEVPAAPGTGTDGDTVDGDSGVPSNPDRLRV
jgi:hypothetical protein